MCTIRSRSRHSSPYSVIHSCRRRTCQRCGRRDSHCTNAIRHATIVAEDVAWRIALVQWQSRRPHRWQARRRQAWLLEYDELTRERERIVHIARFYGVPG